MFERLISRWQKHSFYHQEGCCRELNLIFSNYFHASHQKVCIQGLKMALFLIKHSLGSGQSVYTHQTLLPSCHCSKWAKQASTHDKAAPYKQSAYRGQKLSTLSLSSSRSEPVFTVLLRICCLKDKALYINCSFPLLNFSQRRIITVVCDGVRRKKKKKVWVMSGDSSLWSWDRKCSGLCRLQRNQVQQEKSHWVQRI